MKDNKVLIAIPCLMLGGTEYQTLNLVKALKENGTKVTVLCYFEYDMTMVKYMEDAGADVILMTESGVRPKKFKALFVSLFFGFKKVLKEIKPNITFLVNVQWCLFVITIYGRINVKAHYLSDCMFAICISQLCFDILNANRTT